MPSLGVQLPERDHRPARRAGVLREAFFFLASFVASLLAALLVMDRLL